MSKNPIVKFRQSACQSQSNRCFYCNCSMWQSHRKAFAKKYALTKQQAHYFFCTAEHLQARCDGGSHVESNIVAACKYCNLKRHQQSNPLPPNQYLSFVKTNMKAGNWFPIKPEQVSRLIAGK